MTEKLFSNKNRVLNAELILDEYEGSGLSLDLEYDDGERYSALFIDGAELRELYEQLHEKFNKE